MDVCYAFSLCFREVKTLLLLGIEALVQVVRSTGYISGS